LAFTNYDAEAPSLATTEDLSTTVLEIPFDLQQMRTQAVKKCYDWFEADRMAKQFYMEEMEEMYKLYKSDHWSLKGEDGRVLRTQAQKRARPNAVENISFALVEGFVSEFSQDIDIVDYPVEKGDDEVALIMTDLKEFIAYKNRIAVEREKWLRWFFLYGTGIWHIYWDPTWTGGKGPNRWHGDIRWIASHPQVVYPDARCRDSIEDGRRIHKAFWRTLEYIKEEFPEHGGKVMPDTVRYDMLIGDEIPMETSESGEEQALIVETWYKGRPIILDEDEEDLGPGLHVIWWAGEGNSQYLKHANYVYHDPGENTKFPFIFRQCYPRENSIWGFGEMYFLKNPQIIRNKTAEIIIEGHVHHAMGQTIYNESALTPKQQKNVKERGTLPGMWYPVKDINGIKRLQGTSVPPSLQGEMERLQKVSETLVGRFDISQGRTPGSVTAFRALDLLASRAQVRLRSKEKAMVTAYEDCGNYMNNLISKFYTSRRAYRILGDDVAQTVYGIFDPGMLQRVYIYDFDESMPLQDFERGGWASEFGMIEGEHYEIYCPQYDTQCKVSTSLPTDRIFYMDMAKELYMAQLIDQEIFWYVLDNGKFPPFKELLEKMQEKAQQQAMMLQGQGQIPGGGQPGGQPAAGGGGAGLGALEGLIGSITSGLPQQQGMPPAGEGYDPVADIEEVFRANPQLAQQFSKLSPAMQEQVINSILPQS